MSWPQLRFLNPESDIQKAGFKLPHWQQDSRTYFITFRLADSIPQDVIKKWREERDRWLIAHPKPWDVPTETEYHKIFSAAIDRSLDDCLGSCRLQEDDALELMTGALQFFDEERHFNHAWVVMPNHVHVLVSLREGMTLDKVVGSWKRFSAKKLNETDGDSGAFWQRDYFDRLIRDWDHFINVARYIRNNPKKAGLKERCYKLYTARWVEQLLA